MNVSNVSLMMIAVGFKVSVLAVSAKPATSMIMRAAVGIRPSVVTLAMVPSATGVGEIMIVAMQPCPSAPMAVVPNVMPFRI